MGLKGHVINWVARKVKKLIPVWQFAHMSFKEAIQRGSQHHFHKPNIGLDDIAFLQYTGGTTGTSKGAVLLHRNILSNVMQIESWLNPGLKQKPEQQLVFLCALPMTHIFALTACAFLGIAKGGLLILVPNPRDISGFIKMLCKHPNINIFPGVNTLFHALIHRPEFKKVKFPNLMVTIGGGMAVQKTAADLWQQMTGVPVAEGYGLSETAPVVCVNTPLINEFTGHIGLPLPSTEIQIRGEDGLPTALGEPGEICIRGPNVMVGYYKQEEETRKAFTPDGYMRTGDIGIMDEQGYFRIVDRKKDMIIVSGFNVFPSELENVISLCPGVIECAAVGIPDEMQGETIKVFVVRSDNMLTEDAVAKYCHDNLTGYKRPKYIEFRDELPKSNVGKILRRELRTNTH